MRTIIPMLGEVNLSLSLTGYCAYKDLVSDDSAFQMRTLHNVVQAIQQCTRIYLTTIKPITLFGKKYEHIGAWVKPQSIDQHNSVAMPFVSYTSLTPTATNTLHERGVTGAIIQAYTHNIEQLRKDAINAQVNSILAEAIEIASTTSQFITQTIAEINAGQIPASLDHRHDSNNLADWQHHSVDTHHSTHATR